MEKLVIFDFDGTLADTSDGIIYCYNKSAESFGLNAVTDKLSYVGIIGGTLETGFSKLWSELDDKCIPQAVKLYREYYATDEVQKNVQLYDGIIDTLHMMKTSGIKLAVATLKHKKFVDNMLDYLKIKGYFDYIGAYDGDECRTKKDILDKVCAELNVDVLNSILVGDSSYDAQGAEECGMDFCAVTYGWGFRSDEDAKNYSPLYICNSPCEIYKKICG